MKNKTTDELIDLLQWITDRAAYRRACGYTSGAAYAEECRAEDAALSELVSRGWL